MQLVLCACDAVLPCAQYVQPTSFDLVILFLFWPCADYLALDMFDILYYRTFKFCVSALHILPIVHTWEDRLELGKPTAGGSLT